MHQTDLSPAKTYVPSDGHCTRCARDVSSARATHAHNIACATNGERSYSAALVVVVRKGKDVGEAVAA